MSPSRAGIVTLVAVVGLLLLSTVARADGTITAVYKGTLDGTFVYQPSNPGVWQHKLHLDWEERAVYRVKASGPNDVDATLSSSSVTASGMVSATYAPPNAAMSCTGKIGLRSGFDSNRFGFPTASYEIVKKRFQTLGLAPVTGTYIESAGTGECAIPINGGSLGPIQSPTQTSASDWITPELFAAYNAGTASTPFNVDYTTPNGQSHLVVRATLSLTNTGGKPPEPLGPPVGPDIPADKVAAFRDLKSAIDAAAAPCLQQGTGLLMLGTGGLLLGTGPILGSAFVITGSLTAAALAPLCKETVQRAASDYRRYRDPPFPDFHRVAVPAAADRSVALPSCARRPVAVRAYCASLRAALVKLVVAARTVTSIDRALETTVGRQTAAITAGDRAAFNLQGTTAVGLERRMAAALRAQGAAGAGVRSIVRAKGIRIRLTRAQSAKAIAAVVRLLGRKGITRADLDSSVSSTVLTPRPIDVLAALANPA